MNIIALVGPSSCGKSTVLNQVYNTILPVSNVIVPKKILGNPINNDFSAVIIYKGKKVAFFTMGDYSGALVDAIRDYFAQNCDVVVCACNSNLKRPFVEFRRHSTIQVPKQITQNPVQRPAIDLSAAQQVISLI